MLENIHRTTQSTSSLTENLQFKNEEIVEAFQSEAVFTKASDKRPIVTTYGCFPCVAVGGYDETNNMAFIVHFFHALEVKASTKLVFDSIAKIANKKIEKPIQLHLRGGISGSSEGTIEEIMLWVKQKAIPMEISSEDVLGSHKYINGQSLLIDSRTGRVGEYNPFSNPRRRKVTNGAESAYYRITRGIISKITLAYFPER